MKTVFNKQILLALSEGRLVQYKMNDYLENGRVIQQKWKNYFPEEDTHVNPMIPQENIKWRVRPNMLESSFDDWLKSLGYGKDLIHLEPAIPYLKKAYTAGFRAGKRLVYEEGFIDPNTQEKKKSP